MQRGSRLTRIVTGNNATSTRQVDAVPAGGHYFRVCAIFKNRFVLGDSETMLLKATLEPEEDLSACFRRLLQRRATIQRALFTTTVFISTSKVLLRVVSLSYVGSALPNVRGLRKPGNSGRFLVTVIASKLKTSIAFPVPYIPTFTLISIYRGPGSNVILIWPRQ